MCFYFLLFKGLRSHVSILKTAACNSYIGVAIQGKASVRLAQMKHNMGKSGFGEAYSI